MQLLITVWNREPWYMRHIGRSRNVIVEVDGDGTVGDVAKKLSTTLGIPHSNFLLILCGNKLTYNTPISALLLGPQTSLTAVVTAPCSSEDEKQKSGSSLSANNRNTIQADCKDCEKETAARFCFKCIDCGQVAVPLTHVRNFRGLGNCSICCDSHMKIVVQLNCHHQTCVDCFSTYIKTAFVEHQFAFMPPNGYTVGCPVYNCRGCVVDTHCFYLMGKSTYDEYQRQAAEHFITLEQEGMFCPRANCGASFLWEFSPSNPKIICPECYVSFCGLCRQLECICLGTDATKKTIERICRRCPSCDTPTERNGGCAHMHCSQCGEHWCFLCVKSWSENCQWNHWFD
ncbi:unnamed protein product [Brugia timori]|uniref:E3 ubiquitin-protein ligase parkin n=1 Tax=Brugia timori TaxID=42155 RepID=A0A0R3QWD9_9BILA|nr:unnamed protein product [Brugia timori]